MGVMRGFTEALGVRCQFCHVGKEGQPLSEFDFASDEKETKRTARMMLQMTGNINQEYIAKLPIDSTATASSTQPQPISLNQGRTMVECITCHRGFEKPVVIQQVLAETIKQESVEAALARFAALREKYYGSGGYDFSESVLTRLAAQLQHEGNADGAKLVLEKNAEYYPESTRIKIMLAMIDEESGDKEGARKMYQEVLKMDPENRMAKKALERLNE